ncbi:ThuA domain-containing protein [Haloferula sp. A504]|uniref:ThuA domain-containing protein n=1 Tax=Haloferula sp. A504 TaxID=3373601 RepID=UPI0031C9A55E|nr:ThuA domain-containing protein [Verrucomicrobiaceae bacterium E54]
MIGLRFCLTLALAGVGVVAGKERVLVLSGANNHDWKRTTPVIVAALEKSGRFEVEVEERVMEMGSGAFAGYAVVLSNFNTYGKNAPERKEWPAATRQAFLERVEKGMGLVIIHAGSSMFYNWPEFHTLACGTWKNGATRHGGIHLSQVTFTDSDCPITGGLEPFWIRDEFWERIAVAPGARSLARVTPDPGHGGSGKPQPVIFCTEYGGGRGFALFLGHDAAVMRNAAWETLLLRGTEWAATGKVTIPPAANWPVTREDASSTTTSTP